MITDVIPSDLTFLNEVADSKPMDPPPPTVSGLAQELRVLPPGTPFPGPWDNAKTPYLMEIMDCFSEFSPVKLVALMKSRKVGATTGVADNVSAYWIKNPAPQAYVTASDALAKDWATVKLPAVIHSFGLGDKIVAQNFDGSKSNRSGSTTYKKEYFGGVLDIFSAASKAARRALDKRIIQIDEVDGVEAMTTSGEGNWVEVLLGHGMSWGDRFKAFLFSSPTTEESSNIWVYYQKGDQRKYLVPCPHCGHLQELKFDASDPGKTMRPVYDENGHLSDAFYLCQSPACGLEIESYQKSEFLLCEELGGLAKWIPTATPSDPDFRSYHINSLYAPHEMLSFAAFYRAYLKAIQNPEDLESGMRSFRNLYEGWPYKEVGVRPKAEDVQSRAGTYPKETVPEGVLYLTIGVDVQTGKDSRLELEVLGHGLGYRTWSVDYRVFTGPVDDAFAGAWEAMNTWAAQSGLRYKSAAGKEFVAQLVFVDSGDGNMTNTVYQFCTRWANTYPSKGQSYIRANHDKKEKGDIPGASDFKKYRSSQVGQSGQYLYLVSTNFYKGIVYNNLNVARSPDGTNPPGFADFPADYTEEYFKQLTAESRHADGSFHPAHKGVRTEALDCRVYALCAGDVWLDARVQEQKRWFKANYPQMTDVQLAQINGKYVLAQLEKKVYGTAQKNPDPKRSGDGPG